jgi:hypothetical protein
VEAREAELASAHLILLEQKERLTKELAAELSRVEELRCKAKKMDRRKTDRKMIQEDLMVAKERYVKNSSCLLSSLLKLNSKVKLRMSRIQLGSVQENKGSIKFCLAKTGSVFSHGLGCCYQC